MALSEQEIRAITDQIMKNLGSGLNAMIKSTVPKAASAIRVDTNNTEWLCDTAEEAIAKAKASQEIYRDMSLEKRSEIIAAMRKAGIENAEPLAKMANEETGYGRVEHKIQKNLLVSRKTPGVEDLETYAQSGDRGLMMVEMAPFGVIGSITPSTNPTSSIINNSISMLAAGNAVVFNPHPAAKRCSQEAMRLMVDAVRSAGGPPCLITCAKEPNMETSKVIMNHEDIAMLSVTGGESVVHVAMRTGKKVVAAGPGNPPVIVDETADLQKAARDVANGASFDNNVLCIAEKEIFVVSSVIDRFVDEMVRNNNCALLSDSDIEKVINTALKRGDNGKYVINRKYVGKNAAVILRDAGVNFTGDPKLAIARVPMGHPFVMTEMMMPVLGIVSVRDIDEALDCAYTAEQNCKHSAMIHSTNVHNMSRAARKMNTTIFVKNAPSYSGLGFDGEGCTTMTIATPTGEGVTTARTFTRARRCVLYGDFRIV